MTVGVDGRQCARHTQRKQFITASLAGMPVIGTHPCLSRPSMALNILETHNDNTHTHTYTHTHQHSFGFTVSWADHQYTLLSLSPNPHPVLVSFLCLHGNRTSRIFSLFEGARRRWCFIRLILVVSLGALVAAAREQIENIINVGMTENRQRE